MSHLQNSSIIPLNLGLQGFLYCMIVIIITISNIPGTGQSPIIIHQPGVDRALLRFLDGSIHGTRGDPGFAQWIVNRMWTYLFGGWEKPLWKIWVRQLGWLDIPNISGKIEFMATKPPTSYDVACLSFYYTGWLFERGFPRGDPKSQHPQDLAMTPIIRGIGIVPNIRMEINYQ